MAFGTKILVGILAGIATGVFFGEMTSWLDVAGDVYVRLLQMSVLPYVTFTLVAKIGRLTTERATTLAGRAGLVLLALWALSLVTVMVPSTPWRTTSCPPSSSSASRSAPG